MKLGEITDAHESEKLKNMVLKYQRSKVTFFSYSLSFSLSLSFYISPERASKGLQDGIRIKSVQ